MDAVRLSPELDILEGLISDRLGDHLGGEDVRVGPPEGYAFDRAVFAELNGGVDLTTSDHVLLLLALVPHLRPDFFARVIGRFLPEGGELPAFGGVRAETHRGVLPTGETAQFVVGGDDPLIRMHVQRLLSRDHWLTAQRVLWLEPVRSGEPVMSGRMVLTPEFVERATTGVVSLPRFGSDFPAEHLETSMEWNDAVLHPETLRHIGELEHWIRFNDLVLDDWGMRKRVKPGYRALFHGPPGTGKTLTATLLGKHTGRPVFRIDLSRVVSKYIGETEKNLAQLFDRAENTAWILFFDEADALFGKRTEVRDSHDRFANQEVSYLLQRIESFDGLVILATNQRGNVDDAFLRRFQASVHFPPPGPAERHTLWTSAVPSQIVDATDIDWWEIAQRYELTGAAIVNVAHHCALEVAARGDTRLTRSMLDLAIRRELTKDGKMV